MTGESSCLLTNVHIEASSSESEGALFYLQQVQGSELKPVLLLTFVQIKQFECSGLLYSLTGEPIVVLRQVTIKQPDCNSTFGQPTSWTSLGCGDTFLSYSGALERTGVCSSRRSSGCSEEPLPIAGLRSLSWCEFILPADGLLNRLTRSNESNQSSSSPTPTLHPQTHGASLACPAANALGQSSSTRPWQMQRLLHTFHLAASILCDSPQSV